MSSIWGDGVIGSIAVSKTVGLGSSPSRPVVKKFFSVVWTKVFY